jgi:hypothetical protein
MKLVKQLIHWLRYKYSRKYRYNYEYNLNEYNQAMYDKAGCYDVE